MEVGIDTVADSGRRTEDRAGCDEHATARLIARIASQLFAERGLDATPVRAIAEGAGVTCPTLYYHFRSKEGLAHELVTRPLTGLVEAVRSLAEDRSLDPIARVVRIADAYLAFSRADPDRARLVYAILFGPSNKALACEVDGYYRTLTDHLVASMTLLAEAGVVPRERAECLATALRGQVIVNTINFLYRGGDLGPELAGRIVRDLLFGFGEPEARAALLNRCFTREATRPGADPPGPTRAEGPGVQDR